MSGSRELTQHFTEMLEPIGRLELRRFFGGWALAHDGVQFAMVMDTIYFCVDDRTKRHYEQRGSAPFSYASGSKRVQVGRYYSAPAEIIDAPDELCALARKAMAVAHAAPSPRVRPRRKTPR
jgi:DNA transformation protein